MEGRNTHAAVTRGSSCCSAVPVTEAGRFERHSCKDGATKWATMMETNNLSTLINIRNHTLVSEPNCYEHFPFGRKNKSFLSDLIKRVTRQSRGPCTTGTSTPLGSA